MRMFLCAEYWLNLLSKDPNAAQIYKSGLANLTMSQFLEEESATREMQEKWCLERLNDEIRSIYKALHDATRLERGRAQVASAELTERNTILTKARLAFEKIEKQHQEAKSHLAIAAEIQEHKQKAAELIAREWRKRHAAGESAKEGFVLIEAQDASFELV